MAAARAPGSVGGWRRWLGYAVLIFFAFVFISSESLRTLPVGLQTMVIGDIFPWGQMFAASIMTTIPVVVIYMLAQRFMIAGLSAGSVKG